MNTNQTIDDEMLSAWLDGELSAQDQQAVRAALASDPALAERLAALQRVNAMVLRHAQALDATPLSAGVLNLLHPDAARPTAKVVQGPWQRWTQPVGVRVALAASLVFTLVLTSNYLRGPVAAELPALTAYAEYLDASPSGTTVPVASATLTSRFTFRDAQNRYCRQYQLESAVAAAENIACRTAEGWSIVGTVPVAAQTDGTYQAASGSSELNSLLDAMMQGAALGLDAEAVLIGNDWQDPEVR